MSLTAMTAFAISGFASFLPTSTFATMAGSQMTMGMQLASILSSNASLYLPGSEAFANATVRWQNYKSPDFAITVEVATEEDVQNTVKFANWLGLPYLAVTGGHGAINSLGTLKNGVEIWMRQLNTVDVSEDGDSAVIGGGALSKEVTDALWPLGKQTVTGVCECVGMLGPMLGGGHGWLQGRHGLAADNLLSANVVLANGTSVTASSTSHPDLFWALRGAGHNFGIVTSYKYKIYSVPEDNIWTLETYIFTHEQVEDVLTLANELAQGVNQPVEFINFAYYIRMPDVDPENAVIMYFVVFEGTPDQATKYTSAYRALKPKSITSKTVTYPELAGLTGNGNNDIACQHGYSALRFPISVKDYNVTATRMAYDKFNEITISVPALNNSFLLLEGYSLKAVKAVEAASTAFPDRENNLLLSPVMIYFDPEDDAKAIQAGTEMREILKEGNGGGDFLAYVNYAHGDESLKELYGHEEWRIEKLKMLKKMYDPDGKLNFYAPIV